MTSPSRMAYSVLEIGNNIKRCIEVCITLITTFPTLEDALTSPVASGNMTTLRASSTCVDSRNILNINASAKCLVLQKLFQLIERPSVDFGSLSLPQLLAPITNVGQILQYNRRSTLQSRHNLFRDTMVYISTEQPFSCFKPTQVSFSRMSFALKNRPQSLIPTRNLLNSTSTKEPLIRGDSNLFDTSVNPNKFSITYKIKNLFLKHNVKKDHSVSQKEVSRTSTPIQILLEILRNDHLDGLTTVNRRKRNLSSVKPDIVGTSVISDTGLSGLRTRDIFALLEFLANRFKSLCSLHSSRNSQLRRKILSGLFVDFVVKRDPIKIFVIPSCLTSEVERFCVGVNRRLKDLWVFLKSQFDGSDESHTSYIIHSFVEFLCWSSEILKIFTLFWRGGNSSPPTSGGVSLPHNL